MRSRFQVLRIRRKCSVCSLFMYCSPRRGMYGLTLRGPASRLVLATSGPSPSSASPPAVSRSFKFKGVTGLAGIVGLAGTVVAARTGFEGTVAGAGCALTAAGFGGGAAVGLAAGFATAFGLGAGLAFATTAGGFLAGAAFLSESAFFAMVFLAFVAFAGFLAAILRSLPGAVRNRSIADVDLKRGARLYRRRLAGTGQQIGPTFTYTTARRNEPFLHLRYRANQGLTARAMRLNKIKLAGFKSFVDPTAVNFPSNLIGVVGPNGCGKSNIIDAVRWVMGEISAKHLRGDSMADVVFNGSSSRKPVGTASVELVFDNSDGQLAGQYAGYSEVSLKRVVSRDVQSAYFLNGARCRRKDITQLFLGTGLGSRSYAIIEQGMISRVIEARPEELRGFIEEAAGISKYKERRRETENRISHTKENLDRLNDVREEVDKQLGRLQRQAATARRYQTLKQEERKLTAELLALRLRQVDRDSQSKEGILRERDTAMQSAIADLRSIESSIETSREDFTEKSEALNAVQGRYYQIGSEISRAEQSIQHSRELRQRQRADLEQAEQGAADASL